ncbi:MAG: phosphopyruvate hydratase [Lacrimispora sp.]|uniref:phosphopyruvate hydratase n=1 Tax=Lacrimispora sp. TaxID=2719234 RepID=UPI0039E4D974
MFGGHDIIKVTGRMVWDSRANPAVEAEVILENGAHGKAMVSLGSQGNGQWESEYINDRLSEAVLFEEALDQEKIDRILLEALEDERKGKKSVQAISMAAARAAGAGLGLPLYRYLGGTTLPVMPVPVMTMMSGRDGEMGMDFPELMIVPQTAKSYSRGLRMGAEIYHCLKRLLSISGYSTSVGEDGGFVPGMKDAEEGLGYLMDAFQLSGHKPGVDVSVMISVNKEQKNMISHYLRLTDEFPICGIFNGLWREDSEGQSQMMKMLKDRFLMASHDYSHANGAVISLEAAGTVSNALTMVEEARKAGCKVIISGDSGETEEDFLADMAVAVGADYVKFGAPCRGEWTAKYNEMLRIEEFYNKKKD